MTSVLLHITGFRRDLFRDLFRDVAAAKFRWLYQLVFCWLCSFGLCLLGESPAMAAPPENWEVMRVFVRDQPDQISRLVTRHYATVLLDDLARELSEHDSVRKLATLQTPTLHEALYVARLEGEQIVSDQSRWTVVGNPQAQPLELGNISLALRTMRGEDNSRSLLLDRVQFTASGGVELRPSAANNTYWFGFSASGQSSSGSTGTKRRFQLQIPLAPSAKLLIATSSNIELSSPSVVVQKLAGVHGELPEDWPGSAPASSTGPSQWWLVHLSGVSQFELQANEISSARLTDYTHLVRSANIDYIGSDTVLLAHANFVVVGAPTPSALRFRLAPELKIESVTVDDVAVEWHSQPNPATASNLIELLHLPGSTQDRTIVLKAFCAFELTGQVVLPSIGIDEAFVVEGVCRLSGAKGVVADQLNAGIARVERSTLADVTAGTLLSAATTSPLLWQTRWLGTPPALTATFSKLRHTWHARSLTRLSLQPEWLSANCRMRIESSALTSNEIRLPIGSGWFIDAVRLVQKGSDFRARVEDRKDAANPVVVIYWEEDREQIALELEVVAHSPRQLPADTVSVQVSRLVTLTGADQVDNYVIETSSRFAVQMGAELLAYQRSAVDLPAWQQQLLPEQSEHWIFQGVRGQLPNITLATANGTFSSQVVTVVRKEAAALALETRITITPNGGAIDRINLLLPAGTDALHSQWSLRQIASSSGGSVNDSASAAGATLPLTLAQRSPPGQQEVSSDQWELIELEFPSSLSSPFVLQAQSQVPQSADEPFTTIPIVSVPQATAVESLVVLPTDLAAQLHGKVELLPTAQVFSDNGLTESFDQVLDKSDSRWVTARIDSGSQQLLQIGSRDIREQANWVWSESIEHSLTDAGFARHEARWEVEVTEQVPFQIQLPQGWRLEQVSVDGQPLANSATSSRLLLDMPPGPTAQVYLRCSSRQTAPGWLNQSHLPRPELSLPILESRQTLALPPSRMRVPVFPFSSATSAEDSRLIDRLLPQAAWGLLAPLSPRELVSSRESKPVGRGLQSEMPVGWQRLEISDIGDMGSTGIGVWTISRTALAALCLACVVMTATLFWIGLGGAIRTWWLMIAACAVLLVLVPLWLLPVVQLLSLSLLLAALLRLGCVVCGLRESPSNVRGRSSVISGMNHAPTTSLLILLSLATHAHGQSATTSSPGESTSNSTPAGSAMPSSLTTGSSITASPVAGGIATAKAADSAVPSAQADDQAQEIFSVLIPIDDSGEVSGAYAYAPTRLLELLAGGPQGTLRSEAPRLLSADYTLRMRHSVLGQPDQLQELAVEFRVQASHAEVEIRLPFNSNQLLLQRGSVGGQELSIGSRGLYQVGDAVVFRPTTVGTLRLQLQFEGRAVTYKASQANLQCLVPPIPNATLRIVADSNSNFEVRTAGDGRKAVVPGAAELLGPVDTLDLQWTLAKPRGTIGQPPVEVYADTWLHARGDHLAAVCQLRIEQAQSLPRELHVVVEPGWEPVGVNWQDAKLIGNERSSLGDRRVYTLRCNDDWDGLPRRTLRVMMVPRNGQAHTTAGDNITGDTITGDRLADDDALTVPFLSLREVSQQTITRTLAWSAEPDATWLPEGLDFWQELAEVPGLQWGDLGWTLQPRLYRIAHSLSATLRRVPAAPPARVEEINEIHLGEFETRLNYRAQLAVPGQQALSMLIPTNARVDAVRVDGKAANFRVTERSEHALIELLPNETPAAVRVIEADLSLAVELARDTPVPRVVLRNLEAASSVVRLLRGVGLDCQIDSSPTLQLQSTSLPPHQLLPLLESPVGQFELRNAYRDIPRLPLNFQLHVRPNPPLIGAVMVLQSADQGWKATLRASWRTSEHPLDFAFFDLPAGTRDSVDTKRLAAQIVPHGDASRVTLRLLPPASVAGVTTVEFSFSLPNNGTTQTLSIPSVNVIGEHPVRPLIALPEQFNGQVIHWAQTGRRLADLPESLLADDWREGFQFYELDASQLHLSWKRFEDAPQRSTLYLTRATLLKREPNWISGYVDYWVRPSGQVNLELSVADSCVIVGVETGGRAGVWQRDGQKLSVLLQPNFLPVHVRVLIHWRLDPGQRSMLSLPYALNAISDADALHFIDNQLAMQRVKLQASLAIADSQRIRLLQRWGEVVLDTWPKANNRPVGQTQAWLLAWHPRVLGLDDAQAIDVLLPIEKLQDLNANNSSAPTSFSASELWQRLWLQSRLREAGQSRANNAAMADNYAVEAKGVAQRSSGEYADLAPPSSDQLQQPARRETLQSKYASRQLLSYDGMLTGISDGTSQVNDSPVVLELEVPPAETSWSAQLSAAGLLASAALLALWLATRFSAAYMRLLAVQPWIYWLQLAALAGFLLPVSWPSWVLAVTAVTMFTNQILAARRRNRLLSRV